MTQYFIQWLDGFELRFLADDDLPINDHIFRYGQVIGSHRLDLANNLRVIHITS